MTLRELRPGQSGVVVAMRCEGALRRVFRVKMTAKRGQTDGKESGARRKSELRKDDPV